MVEQDQTDFGVGKGFGFKVSRSQSSSFGNVSILLLAGVFGATIASDNQLGLEAGDVIVKGIETQARTLKFVNPVTHVSKSEFILVAVIFSDSLDTYFDGFSTSGITFGQAE